MPRGKQKYKVSVSPEEFYKQKDPFGVANDLSESAKSMMVSYFILKRQNRQSLLDLACGEGVFTNNYASLCEQVAACDVSPTAIRRAKSEYPDIYFFIHDIVTPFGESKSDIVVLNEALYYIHPDEIPRVVNNIYNLMHENSYFIITVGRYFKISEIKKIFSGINFTDQFIGQIKGEDYYFILGGTKKIFTNGFLRKPNKDLIGKCPVCDYEQICPCEACTKNRGETDIKPWVWINGELIKCANCGHTEHADYWLDWDAECYKGE